MSDDEVPNELYYLDPNFSPRSLRRYQLKAILKSYNISIPPSAKKADMVKLFQQHIESRREEILSKYKTERDVHSSSKKLGHGLRRSRRFLSEEERDEPLRDVIRNKKPVRTLQLDDTEAHEQENKPVERDESGFAIPQVPESWYRRHKISKEPSELDEEIEEQQQNHVAKYDSEEQHNHKPSFTTQDSFASSDEDTSLPQKLNELDDRRRSSARKISHAPINFTAEDSFASSEDDDILLPQKPKDMRERRSFRSKVHHTDPKILPNVPLPNSDIASPKARPDSKVHPAKTGEEKPVTKHNDDNDSDASYIADSSDNEASDEEDELDQELAPTSISGDEVKWLVEDIAKSGSAWRASFKVVTMAYKVLLVLTITTTIFIIGARYRNGYCNSESLQPEEQYGDGGPLSNFVTLPELCIPCPDHGVCVDGQLDCPTFFSRHHRWYSIDGMLPFADECIRDSAIGRVIARAEKAIKRELARQQGSAVCQHFARTGSSRDSPLIKTRGADLYAALSANDFAYVTDTAKLETIVSEALKSIMDDPRVHHWDLDGIPYYGTDAIILPLWCSVYMAFSTIPTQTRWTIFAILISVVATMYGRYAYAIKQRIQGKTQKQVAMITSELQAQLNRYIEEPDKYERGYPVSQLRAKYTDADSPDSLSNWMRVVQAIKREPQVRRSYREIGGEVCEYWEMAANADNPRYPPNFVTSLALTDADTACFSAQMRECRKDIVGKEMALKKE